MLYSMEFHKRASEYLFGDQRKEIHCQSFHFSYKYSIRRFPQPTHYFTPRVLSGTKKFEDALIVPDPSQENTLIPAVTVKDAIGYSQR